ncbi:hypothetical protein D5086_033527 [Populus alba]|uniref:Uncharacterized protein n=1 Tax=Populus alba TaxID=43335 RepID=A0ACC4AH45_POPAL
MMDRGDALPFGDETTAACGSDDIARRLLTCNSILSLLSAAKAAATDGGRCLRFSVGFPSLSGTVDGTVANRDSTSLRVKKG